MEVLATARRFAIACAVLVLLGLLLVRVDHTLSSTLSRSGRILPKQQPLMAEPPQPPITGDQPAEIPDEFLEPAMSDDEAALLRSIASNATQWFEWGTGGSTSTALSKANIKHIHGVESDSKWIDKLKGFPEVVPSLESGRVQFTHADIGEVGGWGHPVDKTPKAAWFTYATALWHANEAQWDTLLVDGRFRVACALVAVEYIVEHGLTYPCRWSQLPDGHARDVDTAFGSKRASVTRTKPFGTVVIHDYQRKGYHFVEKYLHMVQRASRLAAFVVCDNLATDMPNFWYEIRKDQASKMMEEE